MSLYASKSTQGFYDDTINTVIPADAVPITADQHQFLLSQQTLGQIIDWSGDFPVMVDPPKPSPDVVKAQVWEQIKAKRDSVTFGGVKVSDKWFHSDPNSRVQHLGLKDSGRDILAAGGAKTDPITIAGQQILWKCMDGSFFPMTVDTSFQVIDAVRLKDAMAFVAAETHRAKLQASTSPETYDYSAGWPESYVAGV